MNSEVLEKNKLIKYKLKNFILFLFIFFVIFFYQQKIVTDNKTGILANILCFLVYILAIYQVKLSLYFFIFLISLLNFLPYAFNENYFPVILLIFFALVLGFIVNNGSSGPKNSRFLKKDSKIILIIFLLGVLVLISLIIEYVRFANFFPFFTRNYHNLNVNINGLTANHANLLITTSFFNIISGFVFILIILKTFDCINDIKNVIKVIVLANFFSLLIIVFQKVFDTSYGNFEPWISSSRFNSTFTDPNSLGAYTVLIIPLLFVSIFYFKKWHLKITMFTSLIVVFVLLTLSGSRSALIGVLFAIFILLISGLIKLIKKIKVSGKNKKIIYIVSAILILILLFSSITYVLVTENSIKNKIISSGFFNRAAETIKTWTTFYKKDGLVESLKAISNYRYILWERAYQMGKDYLITGVGVGAYIIELPDYHWRYNRGFLQVDYSGNYYLQLFAELGLPGLILFLYLFYLIIKKSLLFLNNNDRRFSSSKVLLLGLFTSFLSMILIFIFGPHTNNIEIQFTFYLIISLILLTPNFKNSATNQIILKNFLINDSDYKSCKKKSFLNLNPLQKICLITILIIFSFSFTQASLGNLSIYSKQNKSGWIDVGKENFFGFYDSIDGGELSPRYTGRDAGIALKKQGKILSFSLKARNPDIEVNPLYVKIYLNYKLLKKQKLNDQKWHKLSINLRDVDTDNITVTLINSRTWNPNYFDSNQIDKNLGVLVSSFEFYN